MKKFKERGEKALHKEVKQLHDRKCFKAIAVAELTRRERVKALEMLTFFVEKKSGIVKARTCANGST